MDQSLCKFDDQDVEQVADLVGGQLEQLVAVTVVGGRCCLAGVGDEDGEDGQHGVSVPAGPAADLVVVEPDLAFGTWKLSSRASGCRRCGPGGAARPE